MALASLAGFCSVVLEKNQSKKEILNSFDLKNTPFKEHLQGLALQWLHAKLPAEGLTFTDFQTDLSTLLLTTQSVERTTVIVKAVLTQATDLHKTSAWVEQEVKFEGMMEGADRADFLLLDLQQSHPVSDKMLDSYNERTSRFSSDKL